MTKALQTAPTGGPSATNPATLTRPGQIEMDEGRPWSGDLYDYGAVTDPGEAFAAFGDGADVEAWLDKGDDGVLIGWVREGDAIYRYSDPEMWSIDVDGAGMARTDGGSATMEGETIPSGAGDELAAEGEEMLEDPTTADTSIGTADPTAFEDEDDEAVTDGDPTAALEDPTDPMVEETTGDGGADAQDAFADMLTDDTLPDAAPADPAAEAPVEPVDAPDDPLADVEPEVAAEVANEPTEPADPADEEVEEGEEGDAEGEMLTIDPNDLPTIADPGDPDDEDPEDPDEDEDADEYEEGKQDRPFERKHLQGEHNQETHGNRVSIGTRKPRASTSSSTGSGSGSAGSPPASPGASAGRAGGKRVTISKASIKAMSDDDLDAIMHDKTVYDDATMRAAATELDERKPLDDAWESAYAKTEPGSLEEQKMLRDVIPSNWVQWAANGARSTPKRSVMAQREDEWLSFMQAQYLAALAATNGQFFNARYRAKGYSEMGFFDGTFNLQQARMMMSPELKEWWDNHWVTKAEFMAEFSDKAKAALANTKRDDLHA